MNTLAIEVLSARMKAEALTEKSGSCCGTCPCSPDASVMDRSSKGHRADCTDVGNCTCASNGMHHSDPKKMEIIDRIMGFQFDPLVHRMVDKYGWNEAEAHEAFEDLKRYLALCATNREGIVPSPTIDDFWHNFILFTEDYDSFCATYVGRFIHHRPRRREEVMTTSTGQNPIEFTLNLARQNFGELSQHWTYPLAKQGDCSDCAPVACGHR